MKCGCLKHFILNFANLICQGTDISKYFRESDRFRDIESQPYLKGCADAPMLSLEESGSKAQSVACLTADQGVAISKCSSASELLLRLIMK